MPLPDTPLVAGLRRSASTCLLLALLGLPFIGVRLHEVDGGALALGFAGGDYALFLTGAVLVLALAAVKPHLARVVPRIALPPLPGKLRGPVIPAVLFAALAAFPLTGFADRYLIELGTVILTYIMLASGLTIVTGLAGLLDLGYVAFYAIGAYAYALLALHFGLGVWMSLPLVALIAAAIGVCIGFPALRLRGDYFAVSTLGFAEILRIIITNWASLTGGPNGMDGIPHAALWPFSFERMPPAGLISWSGFWGLPYSPETRVSVCYYLALVFAVLIAFAVRALRRTPLGRSWEAIREDDIAAAAIGINRTTAKLSAYAVAAAIGGIAGAFFAARQGFISPESFTFIESATILAIIVLGGLGSLGGAAFAALIVIGLPELFREFAQYRMLAFGAGMVILMQVRPGGLFQGRQAQIVLPDSPSIRT